MGQSGKQSGCWVAGGARHVFAQQALCPCRRATSQRRTSAISLACLAKTGQRWQVGKPELRKTLTPTRLLGYSYTGDHGGEVYIGVEATGEIPGVYTPYWPAKIRFAAENRRNDRARRNLRKASEI